VPGQPRREPASDVLAAPCTAHNRGDAESDSNHDGNGRVELPVLSALAAAAVSAAGGACGESGANFYAGDNSGDTPRDSPLVAAGPLQADDELVVAHATAPVGDGLPSTALRLAMDRTGNAVVLGLGRGRPPRAGSRAAQQALVRLSSRPAPAKPQWRCRVCGYEAACSTGLARHAHSHDTTKEFRCPVVGCGKVGSRLGAVSVDLGAAPASSSCAWCVCASDNAAGVLC
jgi:hypothetical protein